MLRTGGPAVPSGCAACRACRVQQPHPTRASGGARGGSSGWTTARFILIPPMHRRLFTLAAAGSLCLCSIGCPAYRVAESQPFGGAGTWEGTLQPLQVTGTKSHRGISGICMEISSGTRLVQEGDSLAYTTGISPVHLHALLVDRRHEI